MSDRFNKPNLLAALGRRADTIKAKYGFEASNGTEQLTGRLSGQDVAVAYGEFRLCLDLIQQIDDGSLLRR